MNRLNVIVETTVIVQTRTRSFAALIRSARANQTLDGSVIVDGFIFNDDQGREQNGAYVFLRVDPATVEPIRVDPVGEPHVLVTGADGRRYLLEAAL